MDDVTQYWIFLTTIGETVISRAEVTAQHYCQDILKSRLMDWSQAMPFPHRELQRYLFQQHQTQILTQGSPSSEEVSGATVPVATLTSTHGIGVLTRQPSPSQLFSTHRLRPPSAVEIPSPTAAELCLRCSISHQIDYACQQLADQFGGRHGFNRLVLVTAVLNDECLMAQQRTFRLRGRVGSTYRSLATEIFETFDPERSSLKVWTVRRVRHDNTVNAILLDHGVYLISDWAILNDTSETQLERILREFYSLSEMEIRQAVLLLESYHTVYRGDRLKQQQTGRCPTPNNDQLNRIAAYMGDLQQDAELGWFKPMSPDQTLQQLQSLAHCLRDYRIHNRGGKQVTESLDDPNFNYRDTLLASSPDGSDHEDHSEDFIHGYHQAFEHSLDYAIKTVVERRVATLRKRKGNRDQLFLKGLALFHCKGQTMTEIAPQLGYERQDKVTYLLKLKELRTDIRHELLQQLRSQVVAIAQEFINPDRLQAIDRQLDMALEEQITHVMAEAEREAANTRQGPLQSPFARRLCHYLDHRSAQP